MCRGAAISRHEQAHFRGSLAAARRAGLFGAHKRSEEQITPVEGLSALSLDALTSVAYGPEAIIVVLAVAGAGAFT